MMYKYKDKACGDRSAGRTSQIVEDLVQRRLKHTIAAPALLEELSKLSANVFFNEDGKESDATQMVSEMAWCHRLRMYLQLFRSHRAFA